MSKKIKLHQIKIVVPHSSIRLQLITGFLVPIIFITNHATIVKILYGGKLRSNLSC